jgi:membrane protein
MEKIKKTFLLLLQRLLITFELFFRNGLINHAAACAYGFLLSAAPALLFISYIVHRVLSPSPEFTEGLVTQIGSLLSVFNIEDLINNFLSSSISGVAGLISIFILFFTSLLCVLSVKRGLAVIFPGRRSVIRDNAVMLGLGFLTIFIVFIILLGFFLLKSYYTSPEFRVAKNFFPDRPFLARILQVSGLALLSLTAYRLVPSGVLKIKNVIPGVLVCIIFYLGFSEVFTLLISPDRYNLIYGTLGRLFLFLIKVFFFFVFFFFGAQMIRVLGNSDALLFSHWRQFYSKKIPPKSLPDRLFAVLPEPLKKYSRVYHQGELIYSKGSSGQEVYYILEGRAGVYLDKKCRKRIAFIDKTHFFGEMVSFSHPEEKRVTSIKAENDLSVIILPPALFRSILKIDPDTDRNLVKTLSDQLKSIDEQMLTDIYDGY